MAIWIIAVQKLNV